MPTWHVVILDQNHIYGEKVALGLRPFAAFGSGLELITVATSHISVKVSSSRQSP